MTERRIISVSSGKGGVGKTTLALNYALSLSRHGKTILIDLDTGTSSVRNCIDTPVERDLYHFFKRGHPLPDCVTTLGSKLDPRGVYRDFGFIASPKHLIEDITNFNSARREELIDAINQLRASFIVLDMKAGLDANVIEFLPWGNSGILVFTPHLEAATLAASDIVKAILFRKLRTLFAGGSPVYADLPGLNHRFVNDLIDRVEDVYDSSVHNLDAFVHDLQHALGGHPVVKLVTTAVDSFVVHYVLNMFNGVRESYDTAVRPFVENLAENVSSHLTILNLGWIIAHEEVNQANKRRRPAVLAPEDQKGAAEARPDAVAAALQKLASQYLPTRPAHPRRPKPASVAPAASPGRYLDVQLDTLKRMYEGLQGASYRDNFRYITYRSLHVMRSRGTHEFGDTRLYKPRDVLETLVARVRG